MHGHSGAALFSNYPLQVVTQLTEGGLHTYTYSDCLRRSKLAALAVQRLGVRPGDRVATMAWNNHRHLELWCPPPSWYHK